MGMSIVLSPILANWCVKSNAISIIDSLMWSRMMLQAKATRPSLLSANPYAVHRIGSSKPPDGSGRLVPGFLAGTPRRGRATAAEGTRPQRNQQQEPRSVTASVCGCAEDWSSPTCCCEKGQFCGRLSFGLSAFFLERVLLVMFEI